MERLVKVLADLSQERRRGLAERRKAVLDATVALITTKQNTGKEYYAGDVSNLFTRLTYLMENDGSAWQKAKYKAEAHGQNPASLLKPLSEKELSDED